MTAKIRRAPLKKLNMRTKKIIPIKIIRFIIEREYLRQAHNAKNGVAYKKKVSIVTR